jgi:hypothetical protein
VEIAVAAIASHDPPETTGAELDSEAELDSGAVLDPEDALDSGAELDSGDDPEEVGASGVSVVCGVSVGVVVCSVAVVWASGACAGAARAFVGLDLCTA